MSFSHPAFFWLSLPAAALVLLMMRRFRRRTLRLPSLQLWVKTAAASSRSRFRLLLHRLVPVLLAAAVLMLTIAALAGLVRIPPGQTEAVYVLDNSLSMRIVSDKGEATVFEEACRWLQGHAPENARILMTSPVPAPVELSRLPRRAAWSEGSLAAAVRTAAALYPGRNVIVLTDRAPDPEFVPDPPVQWEIFPGAGPNTGIISLVPGIDGLYLTIFNSAAVQTEIEVNLAVHEIGNARLTFRIDPGISELWCPVSLKGGLVAEAVLSKGGGAFPGDDYRNVIIPSGPKEVLLAGGRMPLSFQRAVRAAGRTTVAIRQPRPGGLHCIFGAIPEHMPPGDYIIINGEGDLGSLEIISRGTPSTGSLSRGQAHALNADVDFRGISINLTHSFRGGVTAVLAADGKPAACLYEEKGIRAICLAFDPDANPALTGIPAFPVFIQNVLDYFDDSSTAIQAGVCGQPNPWADAYRMHRIGQPLKKADAETALFQSPGLVESGGRIVSAVNPDPERVSSGQVRRALHLEGQGMARAAFTGRKDLAVFLAAFMAVMLAGLLYWED